VFVVLYLTETKSDRVLAGHINALTRQQNKVVRALARHGGDLSSYINQVDDRMDNLMEGIKENKDLNVVVFVVLYLTETKSDSGVRGENLH
jgi:hypothetical protein